MRRLLNTQVVGLAIVMAASAASGLNLAGPQVWNCGYWDTVSLGDVYGPNLQIRKFKPIQITGCRNGFFSGQLIVTDCNNSLRGLKVAASDLAMEDGTQISRDAVQVRFAELADPGTGYQPPYRFNLLKSDPPDVLETVDIREHREWKPKHPGPVAMQPVWITVHVAKDAKPGLYKGTLKVEAVDMDDFEAPIEVVVNDWALPDPRNFHMQNLAFYSPDRMALRYNVERWSDEHFALMKKSMEMMLALGSRQVTLDLVQGYPARDNDESIVRWVKQKDGSYSYDFSAADKYLQIAGEVTGKPFPIRLNMWCAIKKDFPARPVTVVDAESGELSTMEQPPYGTPESLAFWKPVLDELRKKIDARGWFDSTVVNWMNYCGEPEQSTVKVLHDIWPDGKWSSMDHGRRTQFAYGENQYMPVPVSLSVWNEGTHRAYLEWDKKSSPGPREFKNSFKPGFAVDGHARGRHRDWFPLWNMRELCEDLIMRGCDGVDPLGADLWPAQDRRGSWRRGNWTQYALGPGNSSLALLAPGKDGPAATERYEAFREGLQLCETMIFIERAVASGKLNAELAEKANKLLDDRARHFVNAYEKTEQKDRFSRNYEKLADGAYELDDLTYKTAALVAEALK